MRVKVAASREIVVYVPAGGHPATGGIARGSAIVGLPDPGSEEVTIYFEGVIFGQSGMITLADRAVHACGRLRERYPTVATRVVPRTSLVAVGTFDEASGRIMLTGEQSAAAVADWLGVPILDPAELRRSSPSRGDLAGLAALVPDIQVAVTPSLANRIDRARWPAPRRGSMGRRRWQAHVGNCRGAAVGIGTDRRIGLTADPLSLSLGRGSRNQPAG